MSNNSKKANGLIILKADLEAGVLKRTFNGAEFQYFKKYLIQEESESICFDMPKTDEPYKIQGDNLHPFFAGLLPEGLRLKAVIEKIKTSQDDLFSIFAEVGFDCVGDVTIKKENSTRSKIPKWSDINFYDYFFDTLKNDNKENSALAGVQEKISGSMINLPIKGSSKNKSYILKLNPKDKPRLVYNEYHCLELARKCGLKVNRAKLIEDKEKNHGLLIERFDRAYDKDEKKIIKIHQEDACQFLGIYPANKYRVSFNEILKKLEMLCSSPKVEILNATKQYIFSYLICNGDMHAKNISIYVDPKNKTISLTPAYDLISTIVYGDKSMALKVDGRDKNLTRSNFINFVKKFRIPVVAIESTIDSLIKKIVLHKQVLKKIKLEEKKEILLFKSIEERLKKLV